MFILYKGNIISTEGLKHVYYVECSNAMRFEYNENYAIFVKCSKKEKEEDLKKIFEMLEKDLDKPE